MFFQRKKSLVRLLRISNRYVRSFTCVFSKKKIYFDYSRTHRVVLRQQWNRTMLMFLSNVLLLQSTRDKFHCVVRGRTQTCTIRFIIHICRIWEHLTHDACGTSARFGWTARIRLLKIVEFEDHGFMWSMSDAWWVSRRMRREWPYFMFRELCRDTSSRGDSVQQVSGNVRTRYQQKYGFCFEKVSRSVLFQR